MSPVRNFNIRRNQIFLEDSTPLEIAKHLDNKMTSLTGLIGGF